MKVLILAFFFNAVFSSPVFASEPEVHPISDAKAISTKESEPLKIIRVFSRNSEDRCLEDTRVDDLPFKSLEGLVHQFFVSSETVRLCYLRDQYWQVGTIALPNDHAATQNVLLKLDGTLEDSEEAINSAERQLGIHFEQTTFQGSRTRPYWSACIAIDKWWGPIICPYTDLPGYGESVISLFSYDIAGGLAYHRFGCPMWNNSGNPQIRGTWGAPYLPYYDSRVDWWMEFDGFDSQNLCDYHEWRIGDMLTLPGPVGGTYGYLGYVRNGELFRRVHGYVSNSHAAYVTKGSALLFHGCHSINSPNFCGATYNILYSRPWSWNDHQYDNWIQWQFRSGSGNSDCSFKRMVQAISLGAVTPPILSPCW